LGRNTGLSRKVVVVKNSLLPSLDRSFSVLLTFGIVTFKDFSLGQLSITDALPYPQNRTPILVTKAYLPS